MSKHDIYVSELVFEDGGLRGPKGESGDAPSLTVEKVAPYLYTVDYKDWDYLNARIYANKKFPQAGGCAAILGNGLLGHNYDAPYDERAEFIVRTIASKGRHASVSMASIPEYITAQDVDEGTDNDDIQFGYSVLPFLAADGMNDAGVQCAMNAVPDDYGRTLETNPEGEETLNIFLVRYILDYADSVDSAVALLNRLNISAPEKNEISLMIADAARAVRVEFIHNEIIVTDYGNEDKPILTNFHLYGYDGTDESLEPHANGVERYAILDTGFESAETAAGMSALLTGIQYTKKYDLYVDPFWYSDYRKDWTEAGYTDLTKDSPIEDYLPVVRDEINRYGERTRNGETMQTVHTVVYDREWQTVHVFVQEESDEHVICLDMLKLINEEVERATAEEAAIRNDMAEMAERFYTKAEVNDHIANAERLVLADVADHYYTKETIDASLTEQHNTITTETDTKLAMKMNNPAGNGTVGQIIVKNADGSEWQDMPETLPSVTAADNDKVMVVEEGEWVLSDKYADYFRYVNLTVQITADDGGICHSGLIVDIKNADTGDIINSREYLGQPVTFHVPRGMHYRIEQSGTWEGYHNPQPEYIEGAATGDRTLIFTYEAIKIPETLRELEIIVQGGGAASLASHTGLQFADVYEEDGVSYDIIWDLKDVKQVRDENGSAHIGVILQWHYATPHEMPFDAPERLEVDLNVETTAQTGMYYYGQTGSNYRLLALSEGDPLPTTYDALYKDEIRSANADIIRRGYGNYAESAVRKWLNSDEDVGEWFEPSHIGDTPPAQAATMAGFMRGCSDQILGMAMPVRVSTDSVVSNDLETVCDTFFIPSATEVYGVNNVAEGVAWADWIDATGFSAPGNGACDGRKTYMVGTVAAQEVGLRTASTGYQYIVWDIKTDGSLDGYVNANAAKRYAPCCVTYKREG